MATSDRAPQIATEDMMIKLSIPGFGPLEIRRVVTDYTGTHSFKGAVRKPVRARLARLAKLVEVHVLTVDTFGTARRELGRLPVSLHVLGGGGRHDKEKQRFVLRHDPKHVAAFGNGTIDRLLLKTVRDAGGLAVAVDNGEGCAVDAVLSSNILVYGSEQALDLLLDPNCCKATLRF
ncbi:MAG TPA: ATPase P [Candidatus Binatia bacterium]